MDDATVKHAEKMRTALQRIVAYESPARLRRDAGPLYGLDYHEALEMAYENVICEARAGLRRAPKRFELPAIVNLYDLPSHVRAEQTRLQAELGEARAEIARLKKKLEDNDSHNRMVAYARENMDRILERGE